MDLSVRIGKLKLKNPIIVASGTFGYTAEHYDFDEVRKLGALIPKTITLRKREGNPPPRIVETPSGMLNAIGLENPGIDVFIRESLPDLKKIRIPLIISISGNTDKEFIKLAKTCSDTEGIDAIELNLSCPNLGKKILVAQDAQATFRVVRAAKKASRIPVIAKLTPNVTDISKIASAAEDSGADAVSLVNTFAALAVDINTRKPVLGNKTGGLSGPAIKPIALKMVNDVSKKVSIPIIAMGGIMNAEDALEFVIAGATAVAIGTGNFVNPKAPLEILEGIKDYMKKNKIKTIKRLTGTLKTK